MVADLSKVSTDPGAIDLFAPPLGFCGSVSEYLELMRDRWLTNPEARQHIVCVGRMLVKRTIDIQFSGPYSSEAERIARRAADC